MSHHESVAGAAEAAIGDQGHRFSQAFADDRRGHAQHFAHAGAALGAFIADHHHIAFLNALFRHGGHGGFFGIEDARRATLAETLVTADLGHAAFRCKISFQNDQPAGFLQRFIERHNHLLPRSFFRGVGFFGKCFPGNGQRRSVYEFAVQQPLGDYRNAAGSVDIRSNKAARRFEVGQ